MSLVERFAREQQELVDDALDESRRKVRGWNGTIPVRLVIVEQVQTVGAGMQALVTVELPDGSASWSFVMSPDDARAAAQRLGPIGDHAGSGLFVVK